MLRGKVTVVDEGVASEPRHGKGSEFGPAAPSSIPVRKRWQRNGPEVVGWVRTVLHRDPCAYCGAPGGTVDHIVPTDSDGRGTIDNLTGACVYCNNQKRELSLLVFLRWRAMGILKKEAK